MRRVLVLLSLTALLLAPSALADLNDVVGALLNYESQSLPDQGDAILLVGDGQAYTMRNGDGAQCSSASKFVVEASHKAFGLDPAVTFAYGGAQSSDMGLITPCELGTVRQAMGYEIQGSFAGAWGSHRAWNDGTWQLDVSAPDAANHRTVRFTLWSLDGVVEDSFIGTGTDLR